VRLRDRGFAEHPAASGSFRVRGQKAVANSSEAGFFDSATFTNVSTGEIWHYSAI
jgi:hypothetical protein